MVASEVSIYNLALNAIGARNNVTSPTEQSREAEVCNLWFAAVRDQILAAANWPEATKVNYLALLSENDDGQWGIGDANPGYRFAYSLPVDCLRPQYMADYSRFALSAGTGNQRVLSSNTSQGVLFYTMRQPVIGVWSSELQMAVVYALAANICQPLSGKSSRAKQLVLQANDLIMTARASAANAPNEQFETLPEWIAGRGYANTGSGARYFHPYGSALIPVLA